MSYNVYQVDIQCNDNNHSMFFIETGKNGSGEKFHVRRINGYDSMIFERDFVQAPGFTGMSTYRNNTLLGKISPGDLHAFDDICRSIPAPTSQYDMNGWCNCCAWLNQVKAVAIQKGILMI